MLADVAEPNALELVRRAYPSLAPDHVWRKALSEGVLPGSGAQRMQPKLKPLDKLPLADFELGGKALELVFAHELHLPMRQRAASNRQRIISNCVVSEALDHAL